MVSFPKRDDTDLNRLRVHCTPVATCLKMLERIIQAPCIRVGFGSRKGLLLVWVAQRECTNFPAAASVRQATKQPDSVKAA